MKLKTRLIETKDHEAVIELLKDSGFSTMEVSDIENDTIVAELNGKVVGCVWCLIGRSTTGYIGYFAVRQDLEVKKAHTATVLIYQSVKYLRDQGCTKVMGIIMGNEEHNMAATYVRIGKMKICGRFTVMFGDDITKSLDNVSNYFHYINKKQEVQ